MAKYDYDIGVIGGGAAGLTVAAGASQLGVKVILFERAPKLGGDCLHYGCVPSKTLIKTATVYNMMRNASHYGLPDVKLEPVDYRQVAKRIQSVIDTIQVHDSVDRFCGLGVKVEFGEPAFIDEHQVECDGKLHSAKFWVIATGSEPATPPIDGLDEFDYWTNKDMFSLEKLPQSLAILGGGPIACEMAQAFNRLGSEVTLIQRSGQLLKAEDEDMASVVQERLENEGVKVELSASTLRVGKTAQGCEIVIEQGGGQKTVSAKHLLVATGRTPNVDELKLDNAGVDFSNRGVVVDRRLRTSQDHIFAAGDVTGKYQFTHAAGYEGGIVISNAVFRLPRKTDYTWLPWCTYTDPELASVGMNVKRASEAGVENVVWEEPFSGNDRALAEGEPGGKIKLVLDKGGKPLGVQIVGTRAGEIASEWIAALNGKTSISTMASAIHTYPTLSEINKRVAGKVLSEKLFSERVRKTLSFIFDYKGRACTLD